MKRENKYVISCAKHVCKTQKMKNIKSKWEKRRCERNGFGTIHITYYANTCTTVQLGFIFHFQFVVIVIIWIFTNSPGPTPILAHFHTFPLRPLRLIVATFTRRVHTHTYTRATFQKETAVYIYIYIFVFISFMHNSVFVTLILHSDNNTRWKYSFILLYHQTNITSISTSRMDFFPFPFSSSSSCRSLPETARLS